MSVLFLRLRLSIVITLDLNLSFSPEKITMFYRHNECFLNPWFFKSCLNPNNFFGKAWFFQASPNSLISPYIYNNSPSDKLEVEIISLSVIKLMYSFVPNSRGRRRGKIVNLGEKEHQVHLIIIRKWPKKTPLPF